MALSMHTIRLTPEFHDWFRGVAPAADEVLVECAINTADMYFAGLTCVLTFPGLAAFAGRVPSGAFDATDVFGWFQKGVPATPEATKLLHSLIVAKPSQPPNVPVNPREQHVDHIPPSPQRDAETLKVIRYFFRQMCRREDTAPADGVLYLPEYFLQWVHKHLHEYDKDDVLREAEAAEVGWEFLREILQYPTGALMINPLWPQVVLHHRGAPKHEVESIHFVTLITWKDGGVYPMSVRLRGTNPASALDDGFLGARLNEAHKIMMREIHEKGLDVLHDTVGQDMGGEHPFNVFMGAMLRVMPQLDPALHKYLEYYVRLFQFLVREPADLREKALAAFAGSQSMRRK